MFRKSLINIVMRGAMIGFTLAVVGVTTIPMVASARSASDVDIQQIKTQLVNVFTYKQLISTLGEAKNAGAPWQYLLESTALYMLKTGDYSVLESIESHLPDYVDSFSPDNSLLFNTREQAAVFFWVLQASIDIHNGNEKGAADELQKARHLDEAAFKEIMPYAVTIQNYLKS